VLSDPEKKRQHDLGGFNADDIASGNPGMSGFDGMPGGFTFTTNAGGPGMSFGGMPSGGMPGGMGGFDPS